MTFRLAGGAVIYSAGDAWEAVHRYAFATRTLTPVSDPRFVDAFASHEVPRYAYRTYDCVSASDGATFNDLDLFVVAGLNAGVDVTTFVALRSFADRAAAHLDAAHRLQPDFLRLTREELGTRPPAGSAGAHLYEAWRQGMATPGLDVTRVHKTLHHKRPRLVPLLDRVTVVPIGAAADERGCTRWQLIFDEIHDHATWFAELGDRFAEATAADGGVALSWLRLYDILVWLSCKG